MGTSLKHDEEGFLVGRHRASLLEQKLQKVVLNTEETLRLLKGQPSGSQRVVVSGRIRIANSNAANASEFRARPMTEISARNRFVNKGSNRLKVTKTDAVQNEKSITKVLKKTLPNQQSTSLAKQGDQHLNKSELRRQRRQQALELRESQKQTKLLKDIKTKSSEGSSGLLKMLLPLLLGGGLLKSVLKAPAALLGGKAAAGPMRGADGKFIKGGAAAGTLAKGGFLKGLGRAGLFGALISAWNGINVESSDLSREEKNKAHTKNLVVSAGGIGGALAGAKAGAVLGSIVPGWGTAVGSVVGGVLGGFGGAELTSLVVEKVDQVFPEGLGQQMLGSWDGFVGGLGTLGAGAMRQMNAGAQYVYYEVLPTDIAIALGTITGMGRDAWSSITGFASDTWAEVTRMASPYYNAATQFASDAWTSFSNTVGPWFETIGGYAQSAFNTFSQLSGQFFTWLGNTWLGQQAGEAWDSVKSAATSVADWASEKYDNAAGYIDKKRNQASKEYQQGKNGRGHGTGGVAVGGAMVLGNVGAVNGYSKQSGSNGLLGSVSAKHEGRIDSANRDTDQNGNPAGWAYGKFQFNSAKGGLSRFFADNPAIAGLFKGLTPGTVAFNQKWKAIAKADPKGFEAAQNKSAENLWYKPARDTYAKHGFDLGNRGVQEAVFSGAIQHGGMSTIKFKSGSLGVLGIAKKMVGGRDIRSLSPEEQIRLIYAARTEYHRNGKDRYASEVNDAIAFSRNQTSGRGDRSHSVMKAKVPQVVMAASLVPSVGLGAVQKKKDALQVKTASVESIVKNVSIPALAKAGTKQQALANNQNSVLVANVDGPIAHMPTIGRSVSHKHIASIVSGGINMV